MKELFKKQIEESKYVVTEEVLGNMNSKTYHNGDEIKIGDNLLFAIVVRNTEDIIDEKQEENRIEVELIALKEEHFDLYEVDDRIGPMGNGTIPIIKLI